MNTATILTIVKARLGIVHTKRDVYLMNIIESVIDELSIQQKILLDSSNLIHQMFIVDLSVWRYQSRDNFEKMPRHLQFRLHNIIVSNKPAVIEDV